MDWQQAIALAIVTFTAGLMARSWIHQRRHPGLNPCARQCASCGPAPDGLTRIEDESAAHASIDRESHPRSEHAILVELMNSKGTHRPGNET